MRPLRALIVALPLLAGCASFNPPPPQPQTPAVLPASIPVDDLVGNWGLGAYHQEAARARTERAARSQCRNPYRIAKGPAGGLMMHLADDQELSELRLKGGPGGKNYIGPDGPVGEADREIVSFDGKVMILRWLDPETAGRYGTMVYVRCR
jgi:hypothetical protein